MEHALEEHLFILSDSLAVGMQIKNKYVAKCVEDIKRVRRLPLKGNYHSKPIGPNSHRKFEFKPWSKLNRGLK